MTLTMFKLINVGHIELHAQFAIALTILLVHVASYFNQTNIDSYTRSTMHFTIN